MRNFVIVLVIALMAWAVISVVKPGEKEKDALTEYTEGLKSSEEKAEEAKDTANLAIIRSAISQFRGSQGRYPENLDELVSKGFTDRVPQGIQYDKETGEAK